MYNAHALTDQGGTGSAIPAKMFRTVTAGEAIVKGNAVTFYKSGQTMDGIRVYKTTANADFVCGIAQESVASGKVLKIQTKGLGTVDLTTTSSGVAAAEGLVPGSSAGEVDGIAYAAPLAGNCFGYALAADSINTLAAASYILDCWF